MICVTDERNSKELRIIIKLHINQKLFEQGVITEDIYRRAIESILKS